MGVGLVAINLAIEAQLAKWRFPLRERVKNPGLGSLGLSYRRDSRTECYLSQMTVWVLEIAGVSIVERLLRSLGNFGTSLLGLAHVTYGSAAYLRTRALMAGPSSTLPSIAKRLPWQGQSQLVSTEFQ